MNDIASWTEAAWQALRDLPGDAHLPLEEQWEDFLTLEDPVYCVVGPYDSGKSSLIKRLLVDAGLPIPPWLSVSGRRETFEDNLVSLGSCWLRDTPGLSSGREEHDEATSASLALCDAWIVVVPPNLLTDGRERICEMLLGHDLLPGGLPLFDLETCLALVNRMDEAGVDPEDDLDGYRELCRAKLRELAALLSRRDVSLPEDHILTICSDAYQGVGNRMEVERLDYDASRAWDGVDGLQRLLNPAGDPRPQPRETAEVRFLLHAIAHALVVLSGQAERERQAVQATENEQARLELLGEQLTALEEAAQAELGRSLDEELSGAVHARIGNTPADHKRLEDAAHRVCEGWWNQQKTQLAQLVTDYEAEARRTKRRVPLGAMPQADDDDEASPSKVTGQRVAKGLSSFGSALRKGLREWNEIQLGMSLDQARKQLLDIQQAGGLDKFIEAMKGKGRGATIRTADKMKDAKRALAIDSMLGTALPVLMEMGSLVYDVVQEASQAEKKRKRRLELRTRIRRAVDALVQAELRAWRDEVLEPLRTEMEKQQAAHADAGAGHAGQLALFKGHIERLNGLGAEITEVLTER